MSNIQWFPVFGYEDKYEVSTSGEVRVKARDILDKDGEYVTTLKPQILKIQKDNITHNPYVILHNGISYQKQFVEDILERSKPKQFNL